MAEATADTWGMNKDKSWREYWGVNQNHAALTWQARARRVERELEDALKVRLDLGIGEPGDALKVRLENLEELADRLRKGTP